MINISREVQPTDAQRRAIVSLFLKRGASRRSIAETLGISGRVVCRVLAWHEPAVVRQRAIEEAIAADGRPMA